MEKTCVACRKPHATLTCELCQAPLGKRCEVFLAAGTFDFLPKIPEKLAHTHYCPACHDLEVAPELEKYNALMEQAKAVFIFFKTQKRAPRTIRKARGIVRVEICDDEDETILRLAFLAAREGFNALIETEVVAAKVRNEGWHTTRFRGEGLPVQVDPARLEDEE